MSFCLCIKVSYCKTGIKKSPCGLRNVEIQLSVPLLMKECGAALHLEQRQRLKLSLSQEGSREITRRQRTVRAACVHLTL